MHWTVVLNAIMTHSCIMHVGYSYIFLSIKVYFMCMDPPEQKADTSELIHVLQ